MERTEIVLEGRKGEIQLFSDDHKAGKMDISVIGKKLTVYHTEVNTEYEGKGFNCRVSLQTLHTEMNRKEQMIDLNSDDEEFVVLVDSAYER